MICKCGPAQLPITVRLIAIILFERIHLKYMTVSYRKLAQISLIIIDS